MAAPDLRWPQPQPARAPAGRARRAGQAADEAELLRRAGRKFIAARRQICLLRPVGSAVFAGLAWRRDDQSRSNQSRALWGQLAVRRCEPTLIYFAGRQLPLPRWLAAPKRPPRFLSLPFLSFPLVSVRFVSFHFVPTRSVSPAPPDLGGRVGATLRARASRRAGPSAGVRRQFAASLQSSQAASSTGAATRSKNSPPPALHCCAQIGRAAAARVPYFGRRRPANSWQPLERTPRPAQPSKSLFRSPCCRPPPPSAALLSRAARGDILHEPPADSAANASRLGVQM